MIALIDVTRVAEILGRPASAAGHFTSAHPLAQVAADRCRRLHGGLPRWLVACGACWEHAVRTDAVVAAEEDLPELPERDPDLVDDVAVERACAGDRVRLTRLELLAAVRRLRSRGVTYCAIAARLGRDPEALRRLVRDQHDTAPAAGGAAGAGVAA